MVVYAVAATQKVRIHFPWMSASDKKLWRTTWVQGDTEARRHVRESPFGLELRNPIPAHIVDVSGSGFGLEASSSLVPLTQQKFTIGLGTASTTVHGEVRWCKLAETRRTDSGESEPVYRAGVALPRVIVSP